MSNVVKLLQNGTPETMFTNALAEAADVEIAMVVMLRNDGMIRCDWTKIPSSLIAMGLIRMLDKKFMEAYDDQI